MNNCFAYRRDAAIASRVNNGAQSGNGDLERYSDYSGIYSKGLLHDALGIPNAAAAPKVPVCPLPATERSHCCPASLLAEREPIKT